MHVFVRFRAQLSVVGSGTLILLCLSAPAQAPSQPAASRPIAPARPAPVPRSATMLVIAGEPEEAPLLRLNGRAYIDIESLARLTHASVRYVGNQLVLDLSGQPSSAQSASTPPQLSGPFLAAELEAVNAIREWHVALVDAVQKNRTIAQDWIDPMRRTADNKLQLAAAAVSTDPDQEAVGLLRNALAAMQQESDTFLAMRANVTFIPTDSFDNNPQDQKIVACQRVLAQFAASHQFQDDPSCH